MNDEPVELPVYKLGPTIRISLGLLRDAGLWPGEHDPQPGAWWTPLWPWRIGRAAHTRWLAIRERIIDTVHVACHGIPATEDDWL